MWSGTPSQRLWSRSGSARWTRDGFSRRLREKSKPCPKNKPLRPGVLELASRGLCRRVEDVLEPVEHLHGGVALLNAGVRLALLFDRRKKLAILQLDAVHRNVHVGQINLLVLSVHEVVVVGLKRAVIADVAEARA